MQFGEFQSAFQLSVALNLVFSAFETIRAPFIVKARAELDALSRDILGSRRELTDVTDYSKTGVETVDPVLITAIAAEQEHCEQAANLDFSNSISLWRRMKPATVVFSRNRGKFRSGPSAAV
jgi:hypothetical protein